MGALSFAFDLEKWVRRWDERIGCWIANGPSDRMGCEAVRQCYRGSGDRAIDDSAMPEPYVGDPLAGEACGVFLRLNPGEGIETQRWEPRGALVDRVNQDGYYETYSQWQIPERTQKWWDASAAWAWRLSGGDVAETARGLVGIDVVPWHSKKFGSLEPDQGALHWIDQNVLLPAAAIAVRSRLGQRSAMFDAPLAIAVGEPFARALPLLGFRSLIHTSHSSTLEQPRGWPRRSDGRPRNRTFNLFLCRARRLLVLQTHYQGGHKLPAAEFDEVIDDLLSRAQLLAGS